MTMAMPRSAVTPTTAIMTIVMVVSFSCSLDKAETDVGVMSATVNVGDAGGCELVLRLSSVRVGAVTTVVVTLLAARAD